MGRTADPVFHFHERHPCRSVEPRFGRSRGSRGSIAPEGKAQPLLRWVTRDGPLRGRRRLAGWEQVAFARGAGLDQDVFLLEALRRAQPAGSATSLVGADFAPVWSPDGRIGFASSRDGAGNVAAYNYTGANLYARAVGVVGQDTGFIEDGRGEDSDRLVAGRTVSGLHVTQ